MAKALYRKYRPKKLGDVLGHETNIRILQNAAREDAIGQAYLFYGPRGTGKTTTARLVAKLLNCEKRHTNEVFKKKGEPCNKCRICTEIDGDNSFDVIEIDAASNRGIDEIRNLKESIRTAPNAAKHKIYIIDEAHMLTGPAFNALLKTIEEPPAHAVFILATTEYEKLPATITSRTQRFLFKKISKMEMLKKLNHIAKEEKIKIDDDALELIAAAGEGSLRDAESLLEQGRALNSTITLEHMEHILGRVGLKKVENLARSILDKDIKGSIGEISNIYNEGHNIVQLTKDLIHYLRKILSLHLNPGLENVFKNEHTTDELANLKKLSEKADTQELIQILKALIRAYGEIRYSPFAMIPLEIALVETIGKTKEV